MDRYRKLSFTSFAVAGLVVGWLFGPGRAAADFQINIDTTNASLGTGPYGTVTVSNITSTSALVTFAAASGFGFVDGSSLALNVAAGVTTSNAVITSVSSGLPETLTLFTGSNTNIDGLGHFNIIYDQQDSSSPALVEKVTLTGTGFSSSNLSTMLVANDNGWLAAAHIAELASNGQSNGNTGFAAGNTVGPNENPNPVPAPSSLVLASTAVGMLGLIAITRRFRRNAIALWAVS
jgi:hypothetical protein